MKLCTVGCIYSIENEHLKFDMTRAIYSILLTFLTINWLTVFIHLIFPIIFYTLLFSHNKDFQQNVPLEEINQSFVIIAYNYDNISPQKSHGCYTVTI